jgi:hypothetical protein
MGDNKDCKIKDCWCQEKDKVTSKERKLRILYELGFQMIKLFLSTQKNNSMKKEIETLISEIEIQAKRI